MTREAPHPGWPAEIDEACLRATRRNRDQQLADLAPGYCLQVLGDQLVVPVDLDRRRIELRPGAGEELDQRVLAALPFIEAIERG